MKRVKLSAMALVLATAAISLLSCQQAAAPRTTIQVDSGLVAGKVLDSGVKAR